MDRYSDNTAANKIVLGLLRIITAFLFIPHGAQKIFGGFGRDAVELFSLFGVAGVLEFFGGLAILIGLFTRPVAFVLSGLMAVAYWLAHGFKDFWPIVNNGEKAVLYCFIFLLLFVHGAGSFSLDGWLRGNKTN